MEKVASYLWFVAVFFALISASTSSEWGYPDLEAGEKDFPKWGGICDSGTRQSPINLRLQDSVKASYPSLKFVNYNKPQSGVTVVNNGHTVQLGNFPLKMQVSQGPLEKTYVVEQLHFHWNSEHTVDNMRYALEAHIVHRNTLYSDMTAAAEHKDGIVVIGVLFHMSSQPNPVIQSIVDILPSISNYTDINNPVVMKSPFQVNNLFPKLSSYFTYFGSLTTPACNEAVTWIVLQNSFPVSLQQVEQFKSIEHEENKPLRNNYRFIQKTNNRPVMSVQAQAEQSSLRSLTSILTNLL